MRPVYRNFGLILLLAFSVAMDIGGVSGIATPANAITAEEMLDDPKLESRARNLSKQLRCLVCQNQSIDDSDAELARDLRREVRGQLLKGASDTEIIQTLRGKYGDYLLLNPPISTETFLLWLAPVAVLVMGVGIVLAALHTRRLNEETAPSPLQSVEVVASGTEKSKTSIYLYFTCGTLVLAVSLGLYLQLGRADLGDQPLATRQAEIETAVRTQAAQAEKLATALAAAKQQTIDQPGNVSSWLRLAKSAAMVDDSETEIRALKTADEMTGGDDTVKSMLAEALSRAAGGQITMPARELIAGVLARSPTEPRALYLAGLAAYQDGEYANAVSTWQKLRSVSAVDAPWMTLLDQNIADAAAAGGIDIPKRQLRPGPDQADIAAANEMTEKERSVMIEGMVSRLAEKLEENPSDVEGWRRLGRAYEVLGRPADAVSAMVSAADAAPQDADQQIAGLQTIMTSGLDRQYITQASRLIERATPLAPGRLDLLFLRGHIAKLAGNNNKARELWQSLLQQLPADSPFANDLESAIAAL